MAITEQHHSLAVPQRVAVKHGIVRWRRGVEARNAPNGEWWRTVRVVVAHPRVAQPDVPSAQQPADRLPYRAGLPARDLGQAMRAHVRRLRNDQHRAVEREREDLWRPRADMLLRAHTALPVGLSAARYCPWGLCWTASDGAPGGMPYPGAAPITSAEV